MVHVLKKKDNIGKNVVTVQYDSLNDVFEQLNEYNVADYYTYSCAAWNGSKTGSGKSFYYCDTFNEAVDLLKYGWTEGAEKISDSLTSKYITGTQTKTISKYDVVGFQASVPRYLQGIPTNMINQKKIQTKQKVMTIVKHIGFLSNVSNEQILENSVKALAIVKKIEEQGTRCNLDIISPAKTERLDTHLAIRIRIKNANERFNIGKAAFAIANPDMLRRIIFALRYTCYNRGYLEYGNCFTISLMGASIYDKNYIKENFLKSGEKYLNNFIDNIDDEIKNFNS